MRNLWITLLALSLTTPAVAQGSAGIEAAREAARRGDHGRAIELYGDAFMDSEGLADEHAAELGLELTWDDRPANAIPWFERRLEAWPIDIPARLGLARALSWTDQLEPAWFQYRVVYYLDEGNIEARRGEARMLAWMGRLDESIDKYDAILADHPGDIETRIERAQVINWRGEHFRAARLYEEILEDDPGNREAMVGLAQALRWSGYERQAMSTLDPIRDTPSALPLYRDLEFAARPYLELASGWSRDTDDLEVFTTQLAWNGTVDSQLLNHPRSRVELLHDRLSQPGQPDTESWGLTFGGAGKTSLRTTLNAYAGIRRFTSDGTINDSAQTSDLDWTLLVWDAWWTWLARHDLRVDLSTDRNYVQTLRSLGYEITLTQIGVSSDWRLNQEWTLSGVIREGFYSDDNRRTSAQARARWQRDRDWTLYASPRLSGFLISDPSDKGYWNPADFYAVGVDFGASRSFARAVTPRLDFGASREWADGDGYGVLAASAGVSWRITRTWELDLGGGASNSALSSSSGYGRDWVALTLRWRY